VKKDPIEALGLPQNTTFCKFNNAMEVLPLPIVTATAFSSGLLSISQQQD
jgi:hypothetical protein